MKTGRVAEINHTAGSRAEGPRGNLAVARGLQDRFQIHVADQPVEIIGMDAEQFCRFGIVAAGLFHGARDHLLLGFGYGFVITRDGSSGRMKLEEPSTTARSMAFSSSRTFPGQS